MSQNYALALSPQTRLVQKFRFINYSKSFFGQINANLGQMKDPDKSIILNFSKTSDRIYDKKKILPLLVS